MRGFFCLLTLPLFFGFSVEERGFPKVDERGNFTENFSSQGAKLLLSTPRQRYYIGEKIPIGVKIFNEGFYPITIYLNRNIAKNFTFVAKKTDGKSLPPKDSLLFPTREQLYPDAFFSQYTATNHHSRVFVLQPGESYERTFYLQDFVEFTEDVDKLTLSLFFYPNPEQASELFLESTNQLILFFDKVNLKVKPQARYTEPSHTLSPHEVVFLLLNAEYNRDWKNYLKYISLKDLISDYPDFAKAYFTAKAEEKSLILNQFKEFLTSAKNYRLIKFEVLPSNEEDSFKAQVKVKAMREIDGFRREFYYTYYLSRDNFLWKVTGIESQLIR